MDLERGRHGAAGRGGARGELPTPDDGLLDGTANHKSHTPREQAKVGLAVGAASA